MIIKTWNKSAAKSMQLVGAKAQGVKNVMEKAEKDTIDLIKKHVSMHGWDKCALNEDILASKKVWPGQHFRVEWATIVDIVAFPLDG